MVRRWLILVTALFLIVPAFAVEDSALKVEKADTIRTVLERHVSETITVKTDSGEEITGKVESVGDHVVHLSGLSGKEYYDAVVSLDEIAAVIIRTRGK